MTVWRQRFAGEELRCGLAPDRRLEQTEQGAADGGARAGPAAERPQGFRVFLISISRSPARRTRVRARPRQEHRP